MINLDSLFVDGTLSNYLNRNLVDPWKGTKYEGYVFLLPTQKGKFGEILISKYMESKDCVILKAHNKGHDRIIDGFKTELKFGLCTRDSYTGKLREDLFVINHISMDKDWERLIFFGINFDEEKSRFLWFNKKDLINYIRQDGKQFLSQQGGKKIKNDDFMICGNINALIKLDFVKGIDEWFTDTSEIKYNKITRWTN